VNKIVLFDLIRDNENGQVSYVVRKRPEILSVTAKKIVAFAYES
jgi:hypothetical protein